MRIGKTAAVLISALVIALPAAAQERVTLAVFDLEARNLSESEAAILTDELRTTIAQTVAGEDFIRDSGIRYGVVERAEMTRILDEFQLMNCMSDSCRLDFGRHLQADRMVVGSVGRLGETYTMSLRLVEIETSRTITTASEHYQGKIDDLLSKILPAITANLFKTSSPQPKPQSKPRETNKNNRYFEMGVSGGYILNSVRVTKYRTYASYTDIQLGVKNGGSFSLFSGVRLSKYLQLNAEFANHTNTVFYGSTINIKTVGLNFVIFPPIENLIQSNYSSRNQIFEPFLSIGYNIVIAPLSAKSEYKDLSAEGETGKSYAIGVQSRIKNNFKITFAYSAYFNQNMKLEVSDVGKDTYKEAMHFNRFFLGVSYLFPF